MQYAEVQKGNTYTKSTKNLLLHKKGPSITIKDQAKATTKFRKFHKKCKKKKIAKFDARNRTYSPMII